MPVGVLFIGRAASVNAQTATPAATTLITDSTASESSPTEPVKAYATSLMTTTTTAVTSESTAYLRAALGPGAPSASRGAS